MPSKPGLTRMAFVFSVGKSKAMVLAGPDPLELPSLTVYNEQLEWVKPDLELKQDQEQQDQEQEEPQAQAPINVHTCSLQSLGGY